MIANILLEKESLVELDSASLDLIACGKFYLYKIIDAQKFKNSAAKYLLKPSDKEFYLLNDRGLAISHHFANYPINNEPRVLIKSNTPSSRFFNSLLR